MYSVDKELPHGHRIFFSENKRSATFSLGSASLISEEFSPLVEAEVAPAHGSFLGKDSKINA